MWRILLLATRAHRSRLVSSVDIDNVAPRESRPHYSIYIALLAILTSGTHLITLYSLSLRMMFLCIRSYSTQRYTSSLCRLLCPFILYNILSAVSFVDVQNLTASTACIDYSHVHRNNNSIVVNTFQ